MCSVFVLRVKFRTTTTVPAGGEPPRRAGELLLRMGERTRPGRPRPRDLKGRRGGGVRVADTTWGGEGRRGAEEDLEEEEDLV